MNNKNFLVGKILKAQGIKGEVKAASFMDSPDVLCSLPYLIIDDKRYLIVKSRYDKNSAYILLDGINDRNSAETLKNKEIYIERNDAPQPEKGRYYIEDLIGCSVADDKGYELGRLAEIIQSGATDVYVIKNDKGTIMTPALKSVIKKVDIKNKKIVLIKAKLEEVAVYEY